MPRTKAHGRVNPHPSGDPRYDVEIAKEYDDGMVLVRYIETPSVTWKITREAFDDWERLTDA